MGGVLDRYRAVLLDMNGTFMFGEDRFGPTHDYHAIYRELGGHRMSADEVRHAVTGCYNRMAALYEDPSQSDSFPPVRDMLTGLPAGETVLVERVIAAQELGHVSKEYATALQRLAVTHRLAIVANVWSCKGPWLVELQRADVLDLFAAVVFSSDGPHMKPSPVLFQQALAGVAVPASAAIVVGGSLRCDIGGAAAVGLDSVWINPSGAPRPSGSPVPTFEVRNLLELVDA